MELKKFKIKKIKNLRIDFSEAIHRFHGEGLAVLGEFVFGFDHKDKQVFDQSLEGNERSSSMGEQPFDLTCFVFRDFCSTCLQSKLLPPKLSDCY